MFEDLAPVLGEVALGEAVGGVALKLTRISHEVDAAVAELLHSCLDATSNLQQATNLLIFSNDSDIMSTLLR